MLKTLLKKQMAEIFRNYFYDPKKNKMRSKGATIAYIALYALLMVGPSSAGYSRSWPWACAAPWSRPAWTGCITCSLG